MKKTVFYRVVPLFIVAVMLLAACAQPGGAQAPAVETGQQTATPGTAATPAAGASDISNFNSTGYPIVNERITIRVATPLRPEQPADLNTLYLHQRMEEITNIHVEWIAIPNAGLVERRNLMLATGDLPCVWDMMIPGDDLMRFGADGTFIPMQYLIRDYAPNFRRLYEEIPELEAFITAPDGNIYGVARVNSGPWMTVNGVGIINRMWLDNLGLDMPTNIDEFADVLRAFATGDPTGYGIPVTPLTFQGNFIGNHGLTWLASSFGIAIGGNTINEHFVGIRNGQVVNVAAQPEFKEAISWFSMLFSEGLIDMEGFTMNPAEYSAKLNAEPGIVGAAQLWDINDTISNPTNNAAFTYLPLLRGPGGRTPVLYMPPLPGTFRGWGVITRAAEHPEAVMRWIDHHYDEDMSIEMIEGPIGYRVLENPDGTLFVRNPPDGVSVAEDRFVNCRAGLLAMPASVYRYRLRLPTTDYKVNFLEAFQHTYADPTPMNPVFYTAEEAVEMAQLHIDMNQFIERRIAEWIMGGGIEAEWDAFLVDLDRVGQQRWLEIKQAAYDRYMAQLAEFVGLN